MSELRNRLILKQKELNLKDEPFAELLKVTRPYWTMIRNGATKTLGEKVLRGIMRSPELADLRPYVDLYLQGETDGDIN